MKHSFHLTVNSEMKKLIIEFSKKLNLSISSGIIYIIHIIYPLIKKYHNFGEEGLNGQYRFINASSNIHINMDINDYRIIRKIHNDMYIYSMAIIIRWMIEEFFKGIKKYGFIKFLKIMQRFGNIEECRLKRIKQFKKYEAYKHMSHPYSYNDKYKLIFSEDYTLLGFEFLKYYKC